MGTPKRKPSSDALLVAMLAEGKRPSQEDIAQIGLDSAMLVAAMKHLRPHLSRMRGHRPLIDLLQHYGANDRRREACAELVLVRVADRVWQIADWRESAPLSGRYGNRSAVGIFLAMNGKWLMATSEGEAFIFDDDADFIEVLQPWTNRRLYTPAVSPTWPIKSLPLEIIKSLHGIVAESNKLREDDVKKGAAVTKELSAIISRVANY